MSAPALTPRSVSTTLSNGLTATLTEDRSTVAIGGTVTYTVTLINNTTQPITFGYVTGPNNMNNTVPAFLAVTSPSGQNVSPPAGAAGIISSIPSFTLAPGQSLSGSEADITQTAYNFVEGYPIAEGYASAGAYTAKATFVVEAPSPNPPQSIEATVGPLTVTAQ